jgi:hypothetical protein
MTEVAAMVLIVLLALSGYAAGRLHGQVGYRLGYRFGYRQGYFDGDRASWNRRRREMQAALASVLSTPAPQRPEAFPTRHSVGTTYTSAARDDDDAGLDGDGGQHSIGRHARADWVLVEATGGST